MLADEPTGNVDSAAGQQLIELLRDLHREGATIGLVTHDHTLAAAFPRLVTMRDGRIESDSAAGTPA